MESQNGTQSRLHSWVFWASLTAQIVSLLVLFDVIPLDKAEVVKGAIVAVLQIFVAFGVLNNPKDKANF